MSNKRGHYTKANKWGKSIRFDDFISKVFLGYLAILNQPIWWVRI